MINQAVWFALSALIVGGLVRAINTDGMSSLLTYFAGRDADKPVNVPPRLLPWLALALGGISAGLDAKVNGADLQAALASGIGSAAAAAFGHSLGKGVPGVAKVVAGRSSRIGFVLLFVGAMTTGLTETGCPNANSPTSDADASGLVEAGGAVVTSVCDLIQGIDPSGAVRSVCATVEEIVTVLAPFVVSLLALPELADAGRKNEACEPLPHTTVCATSAQRAKAILHLMRVRQARASLDGGVQ